MTIKSWIQKIFPSQSTNLARDISRPITPTPKTSEVSVRKNQAAYVHDLLERLAREAEDEALAKRDTIFSEAVAEHKKDIDGFHFDCDRIGDFLNIKVARMGNPKEPKNHYFYTERPEQVFATAVNLKNIGTIRFIPGGRPDMNGELSYDYYMPSDKMDGTGTYGSTNFGNYLPFPGHHWAATPRYPYIPYSRPLFIIQAPECQKENVIDLSAYDYKIKFTTTGYPRAARDDRIIFEGIGAILFAPAGLGEDVFKQCLRAQAEF